MQFMPYISYYSLRHSLYQPVEKMDHTDKKKKLITFPYPYMNGRLHLGHAYSVLNADMQARYWKTKGYDVLFPFAFHGSGMPIVACAKKLERELCDIDCTSQEQTNILKSMGIPSSELHKFINPEYWITYFSQLAEQDLKRFNVSADFTRSFVTTQMNPYYDRFIRWQFTHLINKGIVKEGTRNVIYSMKDGQPCADHDRHIGEGVRPVLINTDIICCDFTFTYEDPKSESRESKLFVSNVIQMVTTLCGDGKMRYEVDSEGNQTENELFCISKNAKFVLWMYDDPVHYVGENCLDHTKGIYASSQKSFDNIRNQYNVKKINYLNIGPVHLDADEIDRIFDNLRKNKNCTLVDRDDGTGIYSCDEPLFSSSDTKNFTFEMPSGKVVSRSGDECVVAKTTQWFINYGDPDLKKNVKKHLEQTFKTPNKSVYNMLSEAVDWIEEWPCSRNYGLGTLIPGTDKLIDSLSDSTIYMALYTIMPILKEVPLKFVDNELFDEIFLGGARPLGRESIGHLIDDMVKQFMYWYPVDIRVSGKDLVRNHLTMSMFNHQAIWGQYLPESYLVNGYLELNNMKMSKHTGNFITMDDAVSKYGCEAVRFALANNDGMDDGNFDSVVATSIMSKLENESNWIWNNTIFDIKEKSADAPLNMYDSVFIYEISSIVKEIDIAYVEAKYRTVVRGVYLLLASRSDYVKFCTMTNTKYNVQCIEMYRKALATVLTPICPSFAKTIAEDHEITWDFPVDDSHDPINGKIHKDILCDVIDLCNKVVSKAVGKVANKTKTNDAKSTVTITFIKSFSKTELEMLETFGRETEYCEDLIKQNKKQEIGLYKKFMAYVTGQMEKYDGKWIDNIGRMNFEMLGSSINNIVGDKFELVVNVVDGDDKYKFKHNPFQPIVKCS